MNHILLDMAAQARVDDLRAEAASARRGARARPIRVPPRVAAGRLLVVLGARIAGEPRRPLVRRSA